MLETKPGNVSSQMTYLRWQGNFIVTEPETRILKFVTEDEFKVFEDANATAKASKKATTSKSPQERADALVGTITKQKAALIKAEERVTQIEKDLALEPTDEELIEMLELAKAERVILANKLKKNIALAETLPEPNVAAPVGEPEAGGEPAGEVDDEVDDESEDTENEDLL